MQVINDGSLLIQGGVLVEVGTTRRIENLDSARGAVEINAAGKVVMPGFIDSHTHLAFPPPGAGPDEERATRLIRGITGKRLRTQIRVDLAAMARHGTTTVEVKTGCGPDHAAELKLLRVLASLDGDPVDVIPTFLLRLPHRDGSAAVARAVGELLPVIRRRHLAGFADLVCESGPLNQEAYARYLGAVRDLGFVPKVHAAGPECSEAIALAIRYSALSVDDVDGATEEDARSLARSRTMATVGPGAAFRGESTRAARLLVDQGAALSLATQFNSNRPGTLSMQAVIALAHMRFGLFVEEAIAASTINGAHALGCADHTGSLEPGKSADLLILNAGDYRELGSHLGANLVHLAMKRGQLIYREAEVSPPLPLEGSRIRL